MIAYIWQNKFRFKKSACFPLSHLPTHARCAPPMSHRACAMSHHASPQSPTLTPLRDRTPGTPGSSGLPASLLRFVARDSPASVIFEKTSHSWDDVRSALGLRHGGPPPGVFQSVRTSPQCSTASCDGWTDEEEEANSAESVRHDGSEFQEQSDDVCFRLDRALLHALRSRLSTMEVDVDVVAQRVTNLERWREDIEDYDVNVDDFEDDDQTTHSIPEKSKGSHVTSSFSPPQKTTSPQSQAIQAKKTRVSLRATSSTSQGMKYSSLLPGYSQSDPDGSRRARAIRLLHPSPPDSPSEGETKGEFFESIVERYQARGGYESGVEDDLDDRGFRVESPVGSSVFSESVQSTASSATLSWELDESNIRGTASTPPEMWQQLIHDIQDVRIEVANLKRQQFFAATHSA